MNIIVTGGAGFIGSNFIHYLFENSDFSGKFINIDKLTYAGNLENLKHIEQEYSQNYKFIHGDICNLKLVNSIFKEYNPLYVINFAAESHVDRSILKPLRFIQTNIEGTFTLLEVARQFWKGRKDVLFHQISTDEVYGSLDEIGSFYENTPYNPRSPYSATKASADHLVMAYFHTYGIPVTISSCSNNYGYYQFPEKIIPLMINNMLEEKLLPVYGDGKNIRDWLYVEDHCNAIWTIIKNGKRGETYNIGGDNERTNIDLIKLLCEEVARQIDKEQDYYKKLITFVKDRAGHDRRYSINCDKIKKELNWKQTVDFREGIERTVKWYLSNQCWINDVKSGEYRKWIRQNYKDR